MDSDKILKKIQDCQVVDADYIVFPESNGYIGKDNENCLVFFIETEAYDTYEVNQETKSLSLLPNIECTFNIDNSFCTKLGHLLTCKEHDYDKLLAFIRLTRAFSTKDNPSRLFNTISSLFDKENQVSETELQGLFAELYTIDYFSKQNLNIGVFWQSKRRMKFDFTITKTKRMEVKSTTNDKRIHHFKHEQLICELYDILVVSYMLRKSDDGISFLDLVERIRDSQISNLPLMARIESYLLNANKDDIAHLRYDEPYLLQNMRFYDANQIPRFDEINPEGVINAEYDCMLENIQSISLVQVIDWFYGR